MASDMKESLRMIGGMAKALLCGATEGFIVADGRQGSSMAKVCLRARKGRRKEESGRMERGLDG